MRTRLLSAALALAVSVAVLSCVGAESEDPEPTPANDAAAAPAAAAETPADPDDADADDADATGAAPDLPPLLNPQHPAVNQRAPDQFRVAFDTTKGEVLIEVHRDWSPLGADRFYNLVRAGYFDGNRFFRVLPGFVVQFGINGDPAVAAAWDDANIADDPDREMNTRGRVTFAHGGPRTRTTQLFINLGDNLSLDTRGFPPFGEVVEGMAAVQSITAEYGESPNQGLITSQGNAYLDREFPLLDYIRAARVVAER